MEMLVAVDAVCVAAWQLKLQRDEIRLNSRFVALVHLAPMLKDKIDHHQQIIDHQKSHGLEWKGHAVRVNAELRPLLNTVNSELVDAVSLYSGPMEASTVRQGEQSVGAEAPLRAINP